MSSEQKPRILSISANAEGVYCLLENRELWVLKDDGEGGQVWEEVSHPYDGEEENE